jgi:EmrB/QacA subfamily drug resistance transporter
MTTLVQHRQPERQRIGLTFGVLCLGTAAYTLLQSMVLPALPAIQRDLHTSQSAVAWVLTAYLLSASVATPILGRLGDMFGKKRLLVLVFVALSLGSVIAAVTSSIAILIVARAVQGLAGAVFPLAFGIIRDEFPPEKVAGAIGMISALLGIGSGVGIVIAGPVADNLSYHWLFWIPLVLAVIATIASIFFIPESPTRTPGKVNIPAGALLAGWLVALLLGFSQAGDWGWGAAGTLGLFGVAIVLFALWVLVESRSDNPLIDLRMMRIPAVMWANVVGLLLGVGMYATYVVLPPFLQTPKGAGYGFGASVTASGFFMLPSALGMLVIGLMIGRITSGFGSKRPLILGSVVAGIPFLVLSMYDTERWLFYGATAVMGLGIGLAFSTMSNLVMQAVPPEQTGVATGMNANIRTIGGSIGSQIAASIIAAGVTAEGVPKHGGYSTSFALLGAAMVVAGVAAVFVPVRRDAFGSERDTEIDAVWREETGPEPMSVVAVGHGEHPRD